MGLIIQRDLEKSRSLLFLNLGGRKMIITVIWIFFIIIGVINWLFADDDKGTIKGILEIILGLLIRYTC